MMETVWLAREGLREEIPGMGLGKNNTRISNVRESGVRMTWNATKGSRD